MTFKSHRQIYEALIDNKQLRHHTWNEHHYIYINVIGKICYQNGEIFAGSFTYPSDWEVWEPKKQKVKMYLYAYRDSKNSWLISTWFYKDDEDFISKTSPGIKFKKIENLFIEVEE